MKLKCTIKYKYKMSNTNICPPAPKLKRTISSQHLEYAECYAPKDSGRENALVLYAHRSQMFDCVTLFIIEKLNDGTIVRKQIRDTSHISKSGWFQVTFGEKLPTYEQFWEEYGKK